MSERERLYTLVQAQFELKKQECDRQGHDFNIILTLGTTSPQFITCLRCGESWTCFKPESPCE